MAVVKHDGIRVWYEKRRQHKTLTFSYNLESVNLRSQLLGLVKSEKKLQIGLCSKMSETLKTQQQSVIEPLLCMVKCPMSLK